MEFDFDNAPSETSSNAPEYTVSELSGAVKKAVETQFSFVRVRGELGRVSQPASGHIYLDLKDEKAVISGVIWRGKAGSMTMRPEQGLEVIVTGKLTTFAGQSKYQIVIETMEPAGQGALMALLEARRKKLAAEGLFDESAKQKLPFMPRVVGIVTSPTGAVIRDMMHGFRERFPVHVLVWPVRVQGETAAGEIAAAIEGFNKIEAGGNIARPDVLIVARGGGSLEDLWSFNEEVVARAAANSKIPLISAVGHETDWTLIDYVADARAPTPTKAAEWAVPDHAKLLENLLELKLRQVKAVQRGLGDLRTHLKSAGRGLPRLSELIGRPRQQFDALSGRLAMVLGVFTSAKRHRFTAIAGRLQSHLLLGRLYQLQDRLLRYGKNISGHVMRRLSLASTSFQHQQARLQPAVVLERLQQRRDMLLQLEARSTRTLAQEVIRRRQYLEGVEKLLSSLGYQNVLARGYAIVRDKSGSMIRGVSDISGGASIDIELTDGILHADVSGVERQGAAGRKTVSREESESGDKESGVKKSKTRGKVKGDDQGSLF